MKFTINQVEIGMEKLFLIAGPCVLESSEIGFQIASSIKEIAGKLGIPFIFKASYSKANRTSKDGYRGPGMEEGLRQLARIKRELGVPVLSDVHEVCEVEEAKEVLDVLQIPAFLSRQTCLIEAAARTGKPVNLKKAQFMAPWDIQYAVEKVNSCGNPRVLVTERGTVFGYNNLVVDFRTIPILSRMGYLVVFDGTHSTQLPGGGKGESGGQREMIPVLVKAAVAAGCHGLFLEVHPRPHESPSDRESILPLERLEELLKISLAIRAACIQK